MPFSVGVCGMCAMATPRFGPQAVVAVDIDESRLEFAQNRDG